MGRWQGIVMERWQEKGMEESRMWRMWREMGRWRGGGDVKGGKRKGEEQNMYSTCAVLYCVAHA